MSIMAGLWNPQASRRRGSSRPAAPATAAQHRHTSAGASPAHLMSSDDAMLHGVSTTAGRQAGAVSRLCSSMPLRHVTAF